MRDRVAVAIDSIAKGHRAAQEPATRTLIALHAGDSLAGPVALRLGRARDREDELGDAARCHNTGFKLSHFGPEMGQLRVCESPRAMSSATAPTTLPIPQNGTVALLRVPD